MIDHEHTTLIRQRHLHRAHNYLCGRFNWYHAWHHHPHHKKVHWATLGLYLLLISGIMISNLAVPNRVLAATATWNLNTSSEYTYDNAKIEFSGGLAQLKGAATPGVNWIAADAGGNNWGYRKKITFNNLASYLGTDSENLINFPVLIKLNNTNIDYTKVQDAGQDLRFTDSDGVTALKYEIENIGFATAYVGDTVSEISRVFSLFRVILGIFGLIALIVAALGAFNTLTISLLERIREVGLFKALGMRNKDVYKLFLVESLFIGTFGGIIGLALGGFLGQGINFILSIMAQRAHAEAIPLFVTPWFFALGVALFSIIVGFLTGWYPSKRAVKIDPLDALRYE
jgi:ABC-type antimicrobial peptide transport system permease subunit